MIWASITLVLALYMSVIVVSYLVSNNTKHLTNFHVATEKSKDTRPDKEKKYPAVQYAKNVSIELFIACVLWGVFFYLTHR